MVGYLSFCNDYGIEFREMMTMKNLADSISIKDKDEMITSNDNLIIYFNGQYLNIYI